MVARTKSQVIKIVNLNEVKRNHFKKEGHAIYVDEERNVDITRLCFLRGRDLREWLSLNETRRLVRRVARHERMAADLDLTLLGGLLFFEENHIVAHPNVAKDVAYWIGEKYGSYFSLNMDRIEYTRGLLGRLFLRDFED